MSHPQEHMVNPVSGSNFEKFLLNPWSLEKTTCLRIVTVALSVLFGVLTLGTLHVGFFMYRKILQHNVSKIPGANKTKNLVSQKLHPISPSIPQISSSLFPHKGPSQSIDVQAIEQVALKQGFVWFYNAEQLPLTACFGNYFEVPTRVMGCKTAEGAFQMQKFKNPSEKLSQALREGSGDAAFRAARASSEQQKEDWLTKQKNVQAMQKVLTAKYLPGTTLAKALLATGNVYLVEHTPRKGRDAFWADDFDGTGKNKLGELLMNLRQKLGGTGIVQAPAQYRAWVQTFS